MTWAQMEHVAFQKVDELWRKHSWFWRRDLAPRDLLATATAFLTREKVRQLWHDDPEAVRRFTEEMGTEDVLEHPELDLFDEEVGEAVLDAFYNAMYRRFIDLQQGHVEAGTIAANYGWADRE